MRERGMGRGFPQGGRGRGAGVGRRRRGARRRAPRPDRAADLHDRPGHRSRLRRRRLGLADRRRRPALDPHRRRRRPRAARAAPSRPRPTAARTRPTCPGRSSRCCRTRSPARPAASSPARIGSRSRPRSSSATPVRSAQRQLLPQPHPLGRAPRLRRDRRVLRRAQARRPKRSPSRSRSPGRPRRRSRSDGRRRRSQVSSAEPEFRFDGRRRGRGRGGRADRVPHPDRAADGADQRAASPSCEERKKVPTLYRVHEQPDPERIERLVRAARRARDPDAAAAEAHLARARRARSRSRPAAWPPRRPTRRGHGREAYTSLVLRSMKQAHYSETEPRPRRAWAAPPTRTSPRRSAATPT